MFDLKLIVLPSWQGLYSPTDPQNNTHLSLDMIYLPATAYLSPLYLCPP